MAALDDRGVSLRFFSVTGLLFSWGGSHDWVSTGPTAEPLALPLPLPSTIAGALAAIAGGLDASLNRVDLDGLISILENNMGRGFRLKGPLAVWKARQYVLAGAELVNLDIIYEGYNKNSGDVILHASEIAKKGVALSHESKTAIEHMLYSTRYITFTVQAGSAPAEYEEYYIHVDAVHASMNCRQDPLPLQLGGDRGLALFECGPLGDDSLTARALQASERLAALAPASPARARQATGLTILAPLLAISPAPVAPGDALNLTLHGEISSRKGGVAGVLKTTVEETLQRTGLDAKVEEVRIWMPSRLEIAALLLYDSPVSCKEVAQALDSDKMLERLAKALEPRVTLIALGFDARAKRPRTTYPMIAPGSLLMTKITLRAYGIDEGSAGAAVKNVVSALYLNGLTVEKYAARLGWGTVLPLPRPTVYRKALLAPECRLEPLKPITWH